MNNYKEFVMPFGKYKGKKIIEIYEENEGYLKWMVQNIERGSAVKAASLMLSEGTHYDMDNYYDGLDIDDLY